MGRQQELQTLEGYYEKPGSSLHVVYGERLLGKESLIRRFAEGKETHYLHAKPLSAGAQALLWIRELKEQGLELPPQEDYFALLGGISSSFSGKGVLVIADFEHLFRTSGPKFAEEFFSAMKAALQDGKMMVVLLSSSQSFVENRLLETLASQGKLVSGLLKIRPLDFSSLLTWFSGSPYSIGQCIELYSFLGGYPGAWALFGKTLPFEEALKNCFFTEYAPLSCPEEIFLTPYLRELAVYNTLLAYLAAPKESETHYVGRKLNDIFERTGYSRPKILVYLKNLTSVGAVEKLRSLPVSEELQVKAVYRFANPILHFSYSFLFAREQSFSENYARALSGLRAFSREAHRLACEEYLRSLSRAGQLPIYLNQLASWAGKTGSLDLVGRSADGVYLAATVSADPEGFSESRLNYFLLSLQKAQIAPAYLYLFSLYGYAPEVIDRLSGIEGIYLMDASIWERKRL